MIKWIKNYNFFLYWLSLAQACQSIHIKHVLQKYPWIHHTRLRSLSLSFDPRLIRLDGTWRHPRQTSTTTINTFSQVALSLLPPSCAAVFSQAEDLIEQSSGDRQWQAGPASHCMGAFTQHGRARTVRPQEYNRLIFIYCLVAAWERAPPPTPTLTPSPQCW